MAEIELTKGYVAVVDDTDLPLLSSIKWCAQKTGKHVYARNRQHGFMHRYLMCNPTEWQVDHINGNGLDNRRSNLRLLSHGENRHNCYPYNKLTRETKEEEFYVQVRYYVSLDA